MNLTKSKGQNPTEVYHVFPALLRKQHSSGSTYDPAPAIDFSVESPNNGEQDNICGLFMLQHHACPYECHMHNTSPRTARRRNHLAAPMLTNIMAAVGILSRLAATKGLRFIEAILRQPSYVEAIQRNAQ